MTVLAWDGRTLAADKRATHAGIGRTVTKIQKILMVDEKGVESFTLAGTTGSCHVAAELLEWFKDGLDPDAFPESAEEGEALLVVIYPNTILQWNAGPLPLEIENKQCAWGSGRDFAEAAMFLGHGAKRAVEVASHFQIDCGNGVDTLDFGDTVQ